jgi:hypothetical protein
VVRRHALRQQPLAGRHRLLRLHHLPRIFVSCALLFVSCALLFGARCGSEEE